MVSFEELDVVVGADGEGGKRAMTRRWVANGPPVTNPFRPVKVNLKGKAGEEEVKEVESSFVSVVGSGGKVGLYNVQLGRVDADWLLVG